MPFDLYYYNIESTLMLYVKFGITINSIYLTAGSNSKSGH